MVMLNELKCLVNKKSCNEEKLADKIIMAYVAKNIDTTLRKV